jgi:hypothetical protein
MKKSNVEGITNHDVPESCTAVREDGGEALTTRNIASTPSASAADGGRLGRAVRGRAVKFSCLDNSRNQLERVSEVVSRTGKRGDKADQP